MIVCVCMWFKRLWRASHGVVILGIWAWAQAQEARLMAASPMADGGEEFILLTIDKKALHATMQTLPSLEQETTSKILHHFPIVIGKELGDKERAGDNKTPEGVYFTLPHIKKDKLLVSKYGELAIPLDFPNVFDQWGKKTGYGIWLHGAGNDERMTKANVTEGCVAFYNADILRLNSWIQPSHSVVVIASDVSEVNKPADIMAVQTQALAWWNAWKSRSMDAYMAVYDEMFVNNGRTKKAYKDYKKSVFSSYKDMSVVLDQIRIITHPKYAVVFMNQDFKGDRHFVSQGRKILYFIKKDHHWLIIKEHFEPGRFEAFRYLAHDVKLFQSGPLP